MTRKIDPITLEVIRGGLVSLSREMGVAMEKTSYSTIFSEGLDYSCAVFDWEGNMAALHAFDPCHLGAMPYSVQASIGAFGVKNLQPGDIILQNDPYNGGSHINDYTIMTPVFVDNELVVIPEQESPLSENRSLSHENRDVRKGKNIRCSHRHPILIYARCEGEKNSRKAVTGRRSS